MLNTENKNTTNELEKQIIFDAIMDGIVQVNIDGEIIFANKGAERILNISRSNILGKYYQSSSWNQIDENEEPIAPENLPISIALKKNLEVGPIEHAILNDKGEKKWLSVYASPLVNSNNNLYGAIASFRDITDLKNAEIRLMQVHRELEQRQFAIDKHAIVLVVNSDGIINYVNSNFCKISQYSEFELLGKNHEFLLSEYHSKYFFNVMYEVVQSGEIWKGEIYNLSKNGNVFWVATTIIPLKNQIGKIEKYIAFGTDISEQKIIQEQLKLSQQFTNSVLDSVSAHICVINNKGEILAVNKAWIDFYSDNSSNSPKSWTGINYLRTCDVATGPEAEDAKLMAEGIKAVIRGDKKEFILEYPCHSPTEKRWFSVRVTRFHDNSENIVIAHELITKRKLAEEEVKRYMTELENLNQTKNKFFHIIAHDLRNPFSGITGLSELLISQIQTLNIENQSQILKYVNLIQSTSKSAFTLLENLMNWAKTQTGDIPYSPTNLSIRHVIESTLSLVSGAAYNKSISIDISKVEDTYIYADETILQTILRNLLTNAIKFTYPNGSISVFTNSKLTNLEVSIQDNGIGISPENLGKLFRIDSKFTKLGTEKEKGSGLGLILCKEFVEKLGGTIWVNSELSHGSCFTFTLPLAKS